MPKIVLKNVDGTVITSTEEKTIIITGQEFGDCENCGAIVDLRKSCETGEETMVCSSKVCGHEVKLKHIKFFKDHRS